MLDNVNTHRPYPLSRKKFARLIGHIHAEQIEAEAASKAMHCIPLGQMTEADWDKYLDHRAHISELHQERALLINRWHKEQEERKRDYALRRLTRRKFRKLSDLEREALIYFTLSGKAAPAEMFMGHVDAKRFMHPDCTALMTFSYDKISNIVQVLEDGRYWVTIDAINVQFIATRSFNTATKLAFMSELEALD